MAEYNMPQYILREFKVTDARVRTPESVRVLAFYSLCFIVVILAPLCFGPSAFVRSFWLLYLLSKIPRILLGPMCSV